MSSSYNNKKINEKIKITYKNKYQEESNEINFIKRTLENRRHKIKKNNFLEKIRDKISKKFNNKFFFFRNNSFVFIILSKSLY